MIVDNNGGSDNIYIECLPTGSSGEILVKAEPHVSKLFDISEINSLLNNKLIINLFGVFIVMGVMYGGKILIDKISTPSSD